MAADVDVFSAFKSAFKFITIIVTVRLRMKRVQAINQYLNFPTLLTRRALKLVKVSTREHSSHCSERNKNEVVSFICSCYK